jgi:hypothetical protein
MVTGEHDLLRRQHAAYHEAGHVIADLILGYRFTAVTIRPEDSGEYEGAVSGSARGRARDLAVVQLAGIVASAKMAGADPWENPPRFDDDSADIATAGDFIDDWAAFVTKTWGEPVFRQQLWDETGKRTRELVDGNWNPIEVMAAALLERETLSYAEVIGILRERCPEFRAGGKDPAGSRAMEPGREG